MRESADSYGFESCKLLLPTCVIAMYVITQSKNNICALDSSTPRSRSASPPWSAGAM